MSLTSKDKALTMLDRARRWLEDSESALKRGNFDDSIYMSQMCVETSAKAVLTAIGIDYPKEHDVSGVFNTLSSKAGLPSWFYKVIPEFSNAIHRLAGIRGLAAYGYEHNLKLNDFKNKALEHFGLASFTLKNAHKFVDEIFQ